jgi:hypothetical protein
MDVNILPIRSIREGGERVMSEETTTADGWAGQDSESMNERLSAISDEARFIAEDAAAIEVGDEVYVEQDAEALAHGRVVERTNEAGRIGLTLSPGYGGPDSTTEVWEETGRTFTRIERPDDE